MATEPGTLESIAVELANALRPLEDRLAPGEILTLFRELGLDLPASLLGNASFVADLNAAGAAAAALPARITALQGTLAGGGNIAIAAESANLIAAINSARNGLETLANRLQSLSATVPGVSPADVTAFAQDLAKSLFEYVAIAHMQGSYPITAAVAQLLGIIDSAAVNPGSIDPAKPPILRRDLNLSRIGDLISKPGDAFKTSFGWGTATLQGEDLLFAVRDLLRELGIAVGFIPPAEGGPAIDLFGFRVSIAGGADPGLVLSAGFDLPASVAMRRSFLIPGWAIEFAIKGGISASTQIEIRPPARIKFIPPSGTISGEAVARIFAQAETPEKSFVLLNAFDASVVQAQVVTFGIGASYKANEGEIFAEVGIHGGKVIIDSSKGDGFLQKLLPISKSEASFDLLIGVSSSKGLYFSGSSALEIQLPMHVQLGPVSLEGLTIGIKPKDGAIPVSLGADIKGQLGPIVAVVQNMGVTGTFTFPPGNSGNLGPLNLALGFKPPTGVGLSVDTGIIKGGGFLSIDADKGEYVGAMELDFIEIVSLKAIAIINTKMPDGSKGFSLLIIITADFAPIQLGFGFTLNAVGGLLGLNRTVNLDALREGVRTNAIKSILFPQDVVANITRIVSDLKQIFPPLDGRFVVGPMAKLGWGTPSIITVELGILIEIPVPRIAILGVLKAFLPTDEAALLRIQVNFLGVLDFENKYISFDASLFDSRLLLYTLTGDMAFRLSWGDTPMFILSVGGFHPSYHDAPKDLQNMKRLSISLLGGDNPRITVMSYFAVTSNTVQFGARAELYAEAAGFNVYGFIGYDVLFQFDPFKFIAAFEAGLALREGTSTIMGIHVAGQLSGTNPWNARGEASISILFFEISVSFNETWGDSAPKIEPAKEDLIARLTTEINDTRNWKAEIPGGNNLHVTIRKIELPPDKIVIHPMGVLTFSERLVPLELEIAKFGNKVPLNAKRFEIKATDPGVKSDKVTEQFAPANFFDKSDNEKLSSPSFDRLTSGFKVTGAESVVMPTAVNKSVEYELTYLHKKRKERTHAGKYRMGKTSFKASTRAGAVAQSPLSHARNRVSVNAPEGVAVATPQFGIANVEDMRLAGPGMLAGSYTEASEKYSALISRRPELKDQVQILSHHEINDD